MEAGCIQGLAPLRSFMLWCVFLCGLARALETKAMMFGASRDPEPIRLGPLGTGDLRFVEASKDAALIDTRAIHVHMATVSPPTTTPGGFWIMPAQDNLLKFWVIACAWYILLAGAIVGCWQYWTWGMEDEDDSRSEALAIENTSDDDDGLDVEQAKADARCLESHRFFRKMSLAEKSQRRTLYSLWCQQSDADFIRQGAQTLLCCSCLLLLYRGVNFHFQPACLPTYWAIRTIEFAGLVLLIAALLICRRNASPMLYWGSLQFFYMYISMSPLPPFGFSCADLYARMSCSTGSGVRHWYYEDAVRKMNCTMQGQTATLLFMTSILLLPWVIPRFKMIHLFWFWIIGVYLVWTVLYRKVVGEEMHELKEVFIRTIVLGATLLIATMKKLSLEKAQLNNFVHDRERKEASKKMYYILEYMLPQHVIVPLLRSEPTAQKVDTVSILFIVVQDFDWYVHEHSTEDLLKILNDLFTQFDNICSSKGVTKIESISEEYVACVGVIPSDIEESNRDGHSVILERLFAAAKEILQLQKDDLQFRMGVHTGPVVAGVIGHKLPRYRLFGDTINTAARMMQKSLPGELQLGKETYMHLPSNVTVEARGEIEMKGKGKVMTYLLQEVTNKEEMVAYEFDMVRSPVSRRCTMGGLFGRLMKIDRHIPAKGSEADIGKSHSCASVAKSRSGLDLWITHRKESIDNIIDEVGKDEKFTPELERRFLAWWHLHTVCHKLVKRCDKAAMFLLFLTCFEALSMVYNKAWLKPHNDYPQGYWRLPVFWSCRILAIAIFLGLRVAAYRDWIFHNPKTFQWAFVAAVGAITTLIFVSYNALTVKEPRHRLTYTNEPTREPNNQYYSLIFVLVYFVLIRQEGVNFYQSLCFIGIACFIMFWFDLLWFLGPTGLSFAGMGQFLFVANSVLNSAIARADERSSRSRFMAKCATEQTRRSIKSILNTMMPPLVLDDMRRHRGSGDGPPSHEYTRATIAQSDLCGFTKLASTRTPQEVVEFIQELFGLFDNLTDKYGVYKVETVGDAYIAGQAEQPLTERNSPCSVLLFGLGMVHVVDNWSRSHGVEVRCRVGVHHGECIGGIVGTDMQRYHLFGSLMSALEILESTADPGSVQISMVCKEAAEHEDSASKPSETLAFYQREGKLVTSKGEEHEYEEIGGRSFIVVSSSMSQMTALALVGAPPQEMIGRRSLSKSAP